MQTVTIDIINKKALALLKTLEAMKLIRLRKSNTENTSAPNNLSKLKGAMTKQSVAEIDKQIEEMRNEWS